MDNENNIVQNSDKNRLLTESDLSGQELINAAQEIINKNNKKKERNNKFFKIAIIIIVAIVFVSFVSNKIAESSKNKKLVEQINNSIITNSYDADEYNRYFINNTYSEKKDLDNHYNWAKLCFEYSNYTVGEKFITYCVDKEEKYIEKYVELFESEIDQAINDDDFLKVSSIYKSSKKLNIEMDNSFFESEVEKCAKEKNYCMGLKLINTMEENDIELSDSVLKKFSYNSISATFVGEKTLPNSGISNSDFKVIATLPDGTKQELSSGDYIISPSYYDSNREQEITITDSKFNCSTKITVNCPKKAYFDKYSRQAFAEEVFNNLKSIGITNYFLNYRKNENGIIVEADICKKIQGYSGYAYVYSLNFKCSGEESESTSNSKYDKIELYANTGFLNYSEMNLVEKIVVKIITETTNYYVDSSGPILKILTSKNSTTEMGINYSRINNMSGLLKSYGLIITYYGMEYITQK